MKILAIPLLDGGPNHSFGKCSTTKEQKKPAPVGISYGNGAICGV